MKLRTRTLCFERMMDLISGMKKLFKSSFCDRKTSLDHFFNCLIFKYLSIEGVNVLNMQNQEMFGFLKCNYN